MMLLFTPTCIYILCTNLLDSDILESVTVITVTNTESFDEE